MQLPDFTKPFLLHTNASDKAIGAVLAQKGEVGEVVISYASRTLNPAEQKNETTKKECLSIVHWVKQFQHYLHGTQFMVVTDHSVLK